MGDGALEDDEAVFHAGDVELRPLGTDVQVLQDGFLSINLIKDGRHVIAKRIGSDVWFLRVRLDGHETLRNARDFIYSICLWFNDQIFDYKCVQIWEALDLVPHVHQHARASRRAQHTEPSQEGVSPEP